MYPILANIAQTLLLAITPDRSGTFTATVIIAGIGIVFGMLLILIAIFYAFGAIVSNAEKAAKKRAEGKAQKKAELAGANSSLQQSNGNLPVVEDGISDEVVAAISAAIATVCGDDSTVQSIKKK